MEAVVGYCELPRAIDCCQRLLGEASKEKSEKIWDNVPIRVNPSPPPTFGTFLNFRHF